MVVGLEFSQYIIKGSGQFFHRWRRHFHQLVLGIGLAALATLPAKAADKIFFQYGPALRSLEIESIETFATAGTVPEDLAFYFRIMGVTEAEKATFREVLQTPAEIDPDLLARLLYTGFGEEILTGLGNIIRTRSGQNGQFSLRAALILASQDPDGLTLLNVFRQLPTDLQINFADINDLKQAVEWLETATNTSIENMRQLAAAEIAQASVVTYDSLPDLRQSGRYGTQRYRIELTDSGRDRQFYVEIFQPQRWRPGKTPVLLFSHGLGASPQASQEEALHLASYGFLVASIQHPGSDQLQQNAFKAGLTNQIYHISEFLDRPLDVSFLLDHLEGINQEEFDGRLDLENVGMAGHSFGGDTALAVARATIGFDHLDDICSRPFKYLNIALLLQCDALKLPQRVHSFRDSRITSIAVKNPVNSSIFGPEGLANVEVPVLIAAGSLDPATPVVFEQFQTFPWFTVTPRYLVLMEGQAHVDISELDVGISQILGSINGLTIATDEELEQYVKALSVAFFETYAGRKPDYQLYLRSAYARYLSRGQRFKIFMVSEGSGEQLVEPIEGRPLNLE